MKTLDDYKNRIKFGEHLAQPIEQERSKFAASDREINGYAIVWNSANDYKEVVRQGATLKSLNARGVNSNAGNKIQLLLQHDRRQILGTITELREDDYGLFFRATILEDIEYCDTALKQIREGLLKQLSYGFSYVDSEGAYEYDAELGLLYLNEIRLSEISIVTFSSDPNAQLRSSYAVNQFHMRMAQFDEEQIRTINEAFSFLTADEAKESGFLNSITSKYKLK